MVNNAKGMLVGPPWEVPKTHSTQGQHRSPLYLASTPIDEDEEGDPVLLLETWGTIDPFSCVLLPALAPERKLGLKWVVDDNVLEEPANEPWWWGCEPHCKGSGYASECVKSGCKNGLLNPGCAAMDGGVPQVGRL